ncbi:hypothetical protein [Acinetobacter bereziniae]|uniref:hypothetical protein n=1 Tax=Acinetobacter bereziniae TaxID=106648 RepID=UPI000EF6A01C|nr:hypothetical protein [Acinetobacter bereziniae]MBJ9904987.1 hypothetical protein [Acinetobacter bereziniae]MCU4321849.1 hypothetical protein [Acinetobacter bereziniae]MCU4601530.1 hypothetical protein [Acinetobacter bereziniae]
MDTYVCAVVNEATKQCDLWVPNENLAQSLYTLISAFAINGYEASMIACGFSSVMILSYLLKQARKGVT